MITITAAEIDAEVSAWIAANQTGKRRPGIARIAKALGYARLSVKSSVERIERAAAKPSTHRAYCRNSTIECSCTEYGRDHVARLETYDNPAATLLDIPAAVRAYIEAEWRGAGIIALNVAQAGIVTALMAADPKLGETAATFRFHSLVAEMRDNDSIEPQASSLEPATVVAFDKMRADNARILAELRTRKDAPAPIGAEYLAAGPCGNASGRCNHWPQHAA